MVDCTKNLYEILGVPVFATQNEIKFAYKKLVRIYHPDLNKSKTAETAFKLLNNAYGILSDREKRKNYDLILNISKPEQNFKPDNNSIIKEVKITEAEGNEGSLRTVNILNRQKCPKCTGKKFINGLKCEFCLGEGEKSEHKKIEVEIPPKTENGAVIYVGKVNSSALYDKKLFLKIIVEPERKPRFEEGGLVVDVQIPLYDAILGAKEEINIAGAGLLKFSIPPLSAPGTKIRIYENYYALIDVIFPKTLSNEEKNLYDKIRNLNLKRA